VAVMTNGHHSWVWVLKQNLHHAKIAATTVVIHATHLVTIHAVAHVAHLAMTHAATHATHAVTAAPKNVQVFHNGVYGSKVVCTTTNLKKLHLV